MGPTETNLLPVGPQRVGGPTSGAGADPSPVLPGPSSRRRRGRPGRRESGASGVGEWNRARSRRARSRWSAAWNRRYVSMNFFATTRLVLTGVSLNALRSG